jgi:protein required for attachment to host cells
MNIVWVLVCDSARARFFEVRYRAPSWHLVSAVFHEESRSKARDLVTDHAGGRSPEGASAHRNALAPASSPKEVEKEHFAHTLGKTLDEAMRSERFYRWVLVAPPHFAGLIKNELTSELEKHLMATVDKDMSQLDAHELVERLRDAIRIPVDQLQTIRQPSKHAH